MPYISESQKTMLIAAWKKNELEKRLAWLSPTYTQWNPKLPWGTDYEVLTDQPPGTPLDTTNARLEPWRRWNWVTDGTPNKWLNVPYEYPWNMAAGQYSGLSPFYSSLPQTGESNPAPNRGDTRLTVATMDLAVWNPSAYENRPAPPKEMVEDDDTYKFWTDKIIVEELEEVTLIYNGICSYGSYLDYPFYYEVPFSRPYVEVRIKGIPYDSFGFPIWPRMVNPRTGLEEEVRGTLVTWGEEITATRTGNYNPHQKNVFHDGRVSTSVVRWNVEDEWYEDDSQHTEEKYFQDNYRETVPRVTVGCALTSTGFPRPVEVVTSQVEGIKNTWITKSYTFPSGEKDRWEVAYTDAFKYSAYQKKTPYPCYNKPPQSDNRSYWFQRRAVLDPVEDSVSLSVVKNQDNRPEALGGGNDRLEVEQDDAPNTWYARYRYKPSQHWADGWGVRCESANFYDYPEFRVGKIYQDAEALGEAEKDPVTGNYNAFFWQGMHKELYPMFYPGTYVGEALIGDGGLPNTPKEAPIEGETIFEYEERTDTYIPEYTSKFRYGNWFTMPVHHYSANDLYTTLFKQKGVTPDYTNPTSIRSALSSISVPGQPSLLTPPASPTTQMLDTTFIFNKLALVPTDFVHAAGTPLPVLVTGSDTNYSFVSTPVTPVESVATFLYTDNDDEIENPDYVFGGSGGEKIEVTLGGGLLTVDGSAGVAPIGNLKTTPLPTVRPDWATLANYPTGWEIHKNHYRTHQARLIGETEMNHRCESIPNWLDTDGGLLFYYAEGPIGVNEATSTRRTYFYFMRQARLPSYHSTHQGPIKITLEMFFRKRTQTYSFSATKQETTTKVDYDIERYEVQIDFPEGQSLDPKFDTTHYQKDTDPGRSEPNPSKTPSRWGPESSLPTYDFYLPTKNGDSEKIGAVQDKRDWQAFGPYSQVVTSVETYKVETKTEGQGKVYSYVKNEARYIPNPNPPDPPIYDDPNPENWGSWENVPVEMVFNGSILDTTTTTTLTLLDVKIVKIHGPVYRSFGLTSPAP